MSKRLVLIESMRSLGYAPIYLLLARGYLEAQGLSIEVRTAETPTQASQLVLAGQGDIAWGGPIRILMNHDQDASCPLVCFGNVVARDPFVLIAREPSDQFRFADLVGRRVAVAAEVPTAWLTFQDDLARAGIDPESIIRDSAPTMRQNVDRFIAGEVDVVQVFEPHIQALTAPKLGHVVHRFSTRGDISYSSFYTRKAFADANLGTCRSLLGGLQGAQDAFRLEAPDVIAGEIAEYFPTLHPRTLAAAIIDYRAASLWPDTPRMHLAAFLRLKALAVSGGFIATDPPFSTLVHPDLNVDIHSANGSSL